MNRQIATVAVNGRDVHLYEDGSWRRDSSAPATFTDERRITFIESNRVAITPEYEGPWIADLYGEDAEIFLSAEGRTAREAIDGLMGKQQLHEVTA